MWEIIVLILSLSFFLAIFYENWKQHKKDIILLKKILEEEKLKTQEVERAIQENRDIRLHLLSNGCPKIREYKNLN